MNNSKKNIAIIILLVIGALLLFSACRTIVIHSDNDDGSRPPKKPDKPESHISVGDVITVRGRVERERNHYYIHDINSSRTFRVVDLSQQEKNALYEREGDVVKIKLKVSSVESRYSIVAHFVKLYKR
jgi:DNA/RNA endonuclease YhcR with UshA esterase domain